MLQLRGQSCPRVILGDPPISRAIQTFLTGCDIKSIDKVGIQRLTDIVLGKLPGRHTLQIVSCLFRVVVRESGKSDCSSHALRNSIARSNCKCFSLEYSRDVIEKFDRKASDSNIAR